MEDKLVQIKVIFRTELTDEEIKTLFQATLESLTELRQILKLEVS